VNDFRRAAYLLSPLISWGFLLFFFYIILTSSLQNSSLFSTKSCSVYSSFASQATCVDELNRDSSLSNIDTALILQRCPESLGCIQICPCYFFKTETNQNFFIAERYSTKVVFTGKQIYQTPFHSLIYRPPIT
tara:strand:- start:3438 stop:3836 length:399 start_codon:yes stop_codon:yes gene_type:complete